MKSPPRRRRDQGQGGAGVLVCWGGNSLYAQREAWRQILERPTRTVRQTQRKKKKTTILYTLSTCFAESIGGSRLRSQKYNEKKIASDRRKLVGFAFTSLNLFSGGNMKEEHKKGD